MGRQYINKIRSILNLKTTQSNLNIFSDDLMYCKLRVGHNKQVDMKKNDEFQDLDYDFIMIQSTISQWFALHISNNTCDFTLYQ